MVNVNNIDQKTSYLIVMWHAVLKSILLTDILIQKYIYLVFNIHF